MKKTIKRLKNRGVSNLDILKAKEIARRETQKMEAECFEKAFLCMLGIPISILAELYWPKTAKKKIPQFLDDVLSLFDSYVKGVVTEEDMLKSIKELGNVDLVRDWYVAKSKYEDRHS